MNCVKSTSNSNEATCAVRTFEGYHVGDDTVTCIINAYSGLWIGIWHSGLDGWVTDSIWGTGYLASGGYLSWDKRGFEITFERYEVGKILFSFLTVLMKAPFL